MSLINRLTSIFGSSNSSSGNTQGTNSPRDPKIEQLIVQIIQNNQKFNSKIANNSLLTYFMENEDHLDIFFMYLNHKKPLGIVQDSTYAVIFLLGTFHQLFQTSELQYEIALKLKETKITVIQQLQDIVNQKYIKNQDKEPIQEVKIVLTEVDQPSIPPVIYKFDPIQFALNYHTYLQKVSANVDLFKAVKMGQFPYIGNKDSVEPKLMFLWLYKIQNLLNSTMPMIQCFESCLGQIFLAIWNDILLFQDFLCQEISKVVDNYATLPNSDSLSLYEIYKDAEEHSNKMEIFQDLVMKVTSTIQLQNYKIPRIIVQPSILQDFLSFASRLRVLNQITFKKSIKVPNKQNPCMGIPQHNPNLRHLRSTSGIVKNQKDINQFIVEAQDEIQNENQVIQESEEEKSQELDKQEENDQLAQSQREKKKDKKNTQHFRGFSTFQQNN